MTSGVSLDPSSSRLFFFLALQRQSSRVWQYFAVLMGSINVPTKSAPCLDVNSDAHSERRETQGREVFYRMRRFCPTAQGNRTSRARLMIVRRRYRAIRTRSCCRRERSKRGERSESREIALASSRDRLRAESCDVSLNETWSARRCHRREANSREDIAAREPRRRKRDGPTSARPRILRQRRPPRYVPCSERSTLAGHELPSWASRSRASNKEIPGNEGK